MIAYEKRLDSDPRWALQEGSMHFEEGSAVHQTLRKIVTRLETLGIPYAIAGAMAMFLHGYRRFTEDVDILVTREGLQRIHAEMEGRGFLPLFEGSKNLRDADSGVRIEFLVAGEYPGDGKPKPVAFPDPAIASAEVAGVRLLPLPTLIELKLASGLTNPGRLRDLADVQDLIRLHPPGKDFADRLNPFVREKYLELWRGTQADPMPDER
jgi:hypothetical protein